MNEDNIDKLTQKIMSMITGDDKSPKVKKKTDHRKLQIRKFAKQIEWSVIVKENITK